MLRLPVREHPDVRGDPRVVEHVEGQGDDGFEPVVLQDPPPDVALPLARVAREEGRAVVNLRDAAAERGAVAHLGELVHEEHELAVAGPRHEAVLGVAPVLDDVARVLHLLLAAHALQVGLPALAIGRIGQHEVELVGGEAVSG